MLKGQQESSEKAELRAKDSCGKYGARNYMGKILFPGKRNSSNTQEKGKSIMKQLHSD